MRFPETTVTGQPVRAGIRGRRAQGSLPKWKSRARRRNAGGPVEVEESALGVAQLGASNIQVKHELEPLLELGRASVVGFHRPVHVRRACRLV